MKRDTLNARGDTTTLAPGLFDIELAINNELDVRWGAIRHHPLLSNIKFEGDETDWTDLQLTIELDDELELPFEMPDADMMEMINGGLHGFAAHVAQVCADLLAQAPELRAAQSKMRQRVEDFSRELAADGLELPLFWLSLAPHHHWIKPAEVRFDIALKGLGHHLRAEEIINEAGFDDSLVEAFDHAFETQRERAKQVTETTSVGAHGRIDALAVALIAAEPNPLDVFRLAGFLDRVDLRDGNSLYWSDGALRSSGSLTDNVEWFHDRIELPGRWFSAPAAAAMVGQPASDIVNHPAFAGITIRNVESALAAGQPFTVVEIELPLAFFNASTGQTWPDDDTSHS